jgi:hypothetical protein
VSSSAEISEKLDSESQQEVVEEPQGKTDQVSAAERAELDTDARVRRNQFQAELLDVEATLVAKLSDALATTHEVKANVRVSSRNGSAIIDVVARARSFMKVTLSSRSSTCARLTLCR